MLRYLHSFPTRRSSDLDTVVPMTSPQTLAEEYFMKASALDVDESRHNAAATWYRKALEIDPYLVPADRKSTRLNSSHLVSSYAVFCLKKQTTHYSSF